MFIIRRGLFVGIERHAPKLSGVLLDFGCGSKPYRNLFTVDKYIGLDIERSRHRNGGTEADVFYDGHIIPFSDGHFDSVFSSEAFEHVVNIDEILVELNRTLKPGGYMLLTMPFGWMEHEAPHDYYRYTSYGLHHILRSHGFDVVEHEKSFGYLETLAQLFTMFLSQKVFPSRPRIINIGTTFLIYAPIHALAVALGRSLLKDNSLFLNHIVLAQKFH